MQPSADFSGWVCADGVGRDGVALFDSAVLADGEPRQPQRHEPASAFGAPLEHRDGRCGARDQTLRGEHRHARVTLHRPAVAWIQYMAVASTVDREAAFVITARGDRAGGHLQRRDRLLRLLRMTHADPPRRTVTVRAENADVTTKVDETVAQAVTQAKRRRGIGGVFLAEAAERSEEHTTELQSLMSTPYAVFCFKKK